MKTRSQRHILFALSVASVLLSACAKSSDSSSTATAGTSTSLSTTVNASCNAFLSSDANFGGRIETYYLNNNFVEDQLRVRITNLTSSFDANNYTLQFYRWQSDINGNATLDSTPLTFTIYNGTQVLSSAMTSISGSQVSNLRSNTGIGSSSADFFAKTTIVVGGVDNTWQVLKPVIYAGTSAVASADALMPLFSANPNTYIASHAALLNNLHPFYAQRTNGYTDAQYVSLSNQNCFQ